MISSSIVKEQVFSPHVMYSSKKVHTIACGLPCLSWWKNWSKLSLIRCCTSSTVGSWPSTQKSTILGEHSLSQCAFSQSHTIASFLLMVCIWRLTIRWFTKGWRNHCQFDFHVVTIVDSRSAILGRCFAVPLRLTYKSRCSMTSWSIISLSRCLPCCNDEDRAMEHQCSLVYYFGLRQYPTCSEDCYA